MNQRPAVKPRVLALVTAAYGGRGGIAQYNRDYIQALVRTGAAGPVDILPRQQDGTPGDIPAHARQHPPVRGRLAYSAAAWMLAAKRQPDIVFCGHLYLAPLAAFICRLTGARLIVQLHGIEIWARPGPLRRRALEAADLVQCVSRDTRARALAAANLAPERAIVIPNTVMEDFQPGDGTAMRERLGLGASKVLLSTGRLDSREKYKGHEDMFAVAAALIREGHDLLYLVAGDGDDRPRLERAAGAAGLAARAVFLGHVARDELPGLYRAADLFVLPSRREGFGIVFLEAMASGIPALGLREGGARDALDGLGIAIERHELEAAVRRALEGSDHDGEALAARVRAKFGRHVLEHGAAAAIARLAPAGPARVAAT